MTNLQDDLQGLLDDLVLTGQEESLQLAAFVGDELVASAFAGQTSPAGQTVNEKTLFCCWSVSKGISATCIHVLADRGLLNYCDPISKYWPEFAVGGKSEATIADALTHRIGVPQLPPATSHESLSDWDRMTAAIAEQPALWRPGSRIGYHAWTFGWIVGEIVRRVSGVRFETFFQREIASPLQMEFFFGVPEATDLQIADSRDDMAQGQNSPQPTSEMFCRTLPPNLTNSSTLNRPEIRRSVLPAIGGVGNALSIARHYAALANQGRLQSVRIISKQTVEKMRTFQSDEEDVVLGVGMRRAMGYFMGGDENCGGDIRMGVTGSEFGHSGMGGSIGFSDPDRRYAFALTKSLVKQNERRCDSAAYLASQLIRSRLGLV